MYINATRFGQLNHTSHSQVYVSRNPKDVVVSLWHHARLKPEFALDPKKEVSTSEVASYARHCNVPWQCVSEVVNEYAREGAPP